MIQTAIEISSPGALLRAEYGIVPFHGREAEIADLDDWCCADHRIGIRLYTGAGGMGKTRLMLEQARRLQQQSDDWHAGFVVDEAHEWSTLVDQSQPVFLVMDYAETRRDDLISLLQTVFRQREGIHRLRIVLLSRAADDWWQALRTEGQGVGELISGPASTWLSLQPLALTIEARHTSFRIAAGRFAHQLEKAVPDTMPTDLTDAHYEQVLFIHMAALAAVEDVVVTGDQGILDFVLNRERRFWQRQAAAKGLSEDLYKAIEFAMARITLGGGVDQKKQAYDALRDVRLLSDAPPTTVDKIAALLHSTYPGNDTSWRIAPLMPDLLGEHLVQEALKEDEAAIFNFVFGPENPTSQDDCVFISYHSQDKTVVQSIAQALSDAGLSTFIDADHLTADQSWPQGLEQAMNNAGAAVFFVGPQGMGPVQQQELDVFWRRKSRDAELRVVYVLLPGANPATVPSRLDIFVRVDFRDGIEIESLVKRLQKCT